MIDKEFTAATLTCEGLSLVPVQSGRVAEGRQSVVVDYGSFGGMLDLEVL